DGAVKVDPVLGIAASRDGSHLWAVGGYAGTITAAGQGTSAILPSRSTDWYTSSIWRFDDGTTAPPTGLTATNGALPASPGKINFAFFSSPMCRSQCSATLNAQPDVNLKAAAAQIASFAKHPGGPAFAMLGGNARGPVGAIQGNAADIRRIRPLLA